MSARYWRRWRRAKEEITPTVEFIYDADCPNVEAARGQLLMAFERVRIAPQWQEWDRAKEDTPPYAGSYGSPTLLVDGRDVAGVEPSADAACCRVYRGEDGSLSGVPSADEIVRALQGSILADQDGSPGAGGPWRACYSSSSGNGAGAQSDVPGLLACVRRTVELFWAGIR